MSTTPDQPQGPERKPEPSEQEAAAARDALRDLPNQPQTDEAGATAYSAVPPPLPPIEDPAQGPVQEQTVQNKIGGMGEHPQTGFAPPAAEQGPQQSPYQQQPQQQAYQEPQDQPGYGQQPYGQPQYGQAQYGQPQYGQQPSYGGTQYGGAQYGGPYQAAPPPPPYEQGYGYPGAGLPVGMPALAGWGQRVGAFALDNGPAIVSGWIAGATRNNAVEVVFGIIGFFGLIWAIVNAIRAGRSGQSYGKRALGIRLARFSDGQPVGAGLGFLRLFLNWVLWVACVLPGALNLLWPLWDRKRQTWSDKITGSVVVRTQ